MLGCSHGEQKFEGDLILYPKERLLILLMLLLMTGMRRPGVRQWMASPPGCDLSEVRHPQHISGTSALEDKAGGRKPCLGTSVGLGEG